MYVDFKYHDNQYGHVDVAVIVKLIVRHKADCLSKQRPFATLNQLLPIWSWLLLSQNLFYSGTSFFKYKHLIK